VNELSSDEVVVVGGGLGRREACGGSARHCARRDADGAHAGVGRRVRLRPPSPRHVRPLPTRRATTSVLALVPFTMHACVMRSCVRACARACARA
jgi:hypothetical protein